VSGRAMIAMRGRLGNRMKKKQRLVIYKEGPTDYRYIIHGSNPAVRGRFRTRSPAEGVAELAQIKAALPSSHFIGPELAHLKIVT